MVRQSLRRSARGDAEADHQIRQAIQQTQRVRTAVGSVISLLVEAHARTTREGTRHMLKTVEFALRKELGLKGSQLRELEGILARIQANVGELIARLYDPVFQRAVEKGLRRGLGRDR